MVHARCRLLLLVCAAGLLAGCTQDEPPADTAPAAACQPEVATEPPTPPDTSGAPPTELEVTSLAPPPAASCREVAPGDVVVVHYTGRAWSTGEVFDSSLDRGPFSFEVGVDDVIAGWEAGIPGLQVGERARLVVPPDLAYGEAGAPPAIGGNETLVFDVQVVEVLDQATPATTDDPTEGAP